LRRFADGNWLNHPNLNQDELEAFCLNLRLLIQDRDGFSIRKIRQLAQDWSATYQAEREAIAQAVNELHRRLEESSLVALPGADRTTNKDMFDVVFYGGIAHADPAKRGQFQQMATAGAFSFFMFRAFCGVLFHYRNCITQIAYHLGRYTWPKRRRDVPANKSIDTDVLSAGFAGLLSAGHFQR
jgi:DNA-binding transcriptional MerR regulator